jgi:hypothetical protein
MLDVGRTRLAQEDPDDVDAHLSGMPIVGAKPLACQHTQSAHLARRHRGER